LTVISGVRADRYQGAGSDKKQTRRHPDPGRPALASNERGSRPARIPCRSGFSRDARGRLTVISGGPCRPGSGCRLRQEANSPAPWSRPTRTRFERAWVPTRSHSTHRIRWTSTTAVGAHSVGDRCRGRARSALMQRKASRADW